MLPRAMPLLHVFICVFLIFSCARIHSLRQLPSRHIIRQHKGSCVSVLRISCFSFFCLGRGVFSVRHGYILEHIQLYKLQVCVCALVRLRLCCCFWLWLLHSPLCVFFAQSLPARLLLRRQPSYGVRALPKGNLPITAWTNSVPCLPGHFCSSLCCSRVCCVLCVAWLRFKCHQLDPVRALCPRLLFNRWS